MDEKKRKVMIVDDEPHIRKFLKINLQRSGFAVVECGTGEAAVEAFAQDKADICLLDIMLPGMSGYEAFSRLREMDSDIPIDHVDCHVAGYGQGYGA